jgi:pyruvate/2-oxoglutarate dehydrogenase complex dihydrolipoamide dehydrogenase (E3) component
MVSELALAIESGMNAEDIALTIHPLSCLMTRHDRYQRMGI